MSAENPSFMNGMRAIIAGDEGHETNSAEDSSLTANASPPTRQAGQLQAVVEPYDRLWGIRSHGSSSETAVAVVKVGEMQFNANAKALSENSAMFCMALRDSWRTKGSPVVEISAQDPDAVQIFFDWINGKSGFNAGSSVSIERFTYTALFKAFIFGEETKSPRFQNDVMDMIAAKLSAHHEPEPALPRLAYERTPPNSPLRRILVDAYARDGGPEMVLDEARISGLRPGFLRDLVAALYCMRDGAYKSSRRPYYVDSMGCRYHNHTNNPYEHCDGLKFTINQPSGYAPQPDSSHTASNPSPRSPTFTEELFTITPHNNTCPTMDVQDSGIGMSADAHIKQEILDPQTPCPPERGAKRRRQDGASGSRGLTKLSQLPAGAEVITLD